MSFLSINTMSKKLLVILMSMAIFSAAMVTVVLSAYEFVSAKREQTQSLQNIADTLSPNITAALLFDDRDAMQEMISSLLLREGVIRAAITDTEQQNLAVVESDNYQEELAEEADELIEVSSLLILDEQVYGALTVLANDSYIDQRIGFYGQFLAVLLVITFGLSLSFSLFLKRGFLRPLLHLSDVAERVTASNDYSLRAQQSSDDEVANLTECFNGMLETIELRERMLEKQVRLRTQELEGANQQLLQYAYTDGLTGLPNRHFFYEKLHTLVKEKIEFALIFIDLDGFKEINDTLGHDYGDVLLSQAGQRILRCVREQDTVARLGGDEFTIVIEGVNEQARVANIAETVLQGLAKRFTIKQEAAHVSGSIGIAFSPLDGDSVEAVVKHADQAMYVSKSRGRNCYQFFSSDMQVEAQQKRRLLEELRTALEEEQFELYYQPITSLKFETEEGGVKKAEALLRWNHPQRGVVGPEEFIHVAEEAGLIRELSQWVMQQTVATVSQWYKQGLDDIQISVNTSPSQFNDGGKWIDDWIHAIALHELPAHSIMIEITENVLMTTDDSIKDQLSRLQQRGFDVAIDDFGVGYSSLSYLQQLDIDLLKIDRSFIQHLTTDNDSVALVKAIVTMAHHLGLKVVAEGVETEQQRQHVLNVACDFLQGYIFAKPVPKDEFYHRYLLGNAEIT
ncbi:EAL domain-containing protein [Agarivorans sp. B2Z047]|uniref:putative bifunctional diguanylate cyclase/phosphodiesterase n=1 Tax=Agarivorans sp. B2Z047 TaxID=2652721 RepID=UPI00128E4674|nr:EAL domain-containing protein [Agarivorans sp. B2Z047]MPW29397.1 EAL domain-containing protein [Agarivorans sp. B2Z047]UQN44987.1 EAL domain-containing protein [Agarivorans sp. B2Z047]